MGDSTETEHRRPGLPGFAASFASSARSPGERETSPVLRRVISAIVVVAVVGAGVVGIGKMTDFANKKNTSAVSAAGAHTEQASPPSAQRLGPGTFAVHQDTGPNPNSPLSPETATRGIQAGVHGAPPAGALSTGDNSAHGTSSPHKNLTAAGRRGDAPVAGVPGSPTGGQPAQQPPSTNAGTPAGNGTGTTASSGDNGSVTTFQKSATGGQAAAPPSVSIVNYDTNRCVDVVDHLENAPPQTPTQIWDCAGTPNQKWQFFPDGTVRSGGLCLSTAGGSTASGAVVDVFTCNGGANQKWVLNGSWDMVNQAADRCLDVVDHGTANGSRLQIWTCKGTSNQKWHLG